MTRHHVISTTGCDVFFKMVTQYQAKIYEKVLNDFFKNRKSPNNLPGNDIDHDPVFDIP